MVGRAKVRVASLDDLWTDGGASQERGPLDHRRIDQPLATDLRQAHLISFAKAHRGGRHGYQAGADDATRDDRRHECPARRVEDEVFHASSIGPIRGSKQPRIIASLENLEIGGVPVQRREHESQRGW